jgi:predicted Mrr-cat superfamily restriction endonuclease
MGVRTCWLIRAGDRNKLAEGFLSSGIVSVSWSNVDGLGDVSKLTRNEVQRIFAASELPRPEQHSAQLLQFRDRVAEGDVVVTPTADRGVLLGEILGPYRWLESSPTTDYRHTRTTRWDGYFERDHLPEHLAKELNWRSTLRILTHQEEWRALAERAQAGDAPRPRITRAGTRRTRIAARDSMTTGVRRLCPRCGMSKLAAQFSGLPVCVDCR